jgi:hypothetical protein
MRLNEGVAEEWVRASVERKQASIGAICRERRQASVGGCEKREKVDGRKEGRESDEESGTGTKASPTTTCRFTYGMYTHTTKKTVVLLQPTALKRARLDL